MDNPTILQMDFQKYDQIRLILNTKSIRDMFVAVLPTHIFNYEINQKMKTEGCRGTMTPGEWLLTYLDSRGGRVSDLIYWFEKLNLQSALIYLKQEEPLHIVEQPQSTITVQEGAELQLICRAMGYPPPEYQWFKDKEELLLQQDSVLYISHVRKEDSGIYKCLVYKQNSSVKNFESQIFSNPVVVSIISNELDDFPNLNFEQQQQITAKLSAPSKNPEQNTMVRSCPNSEKICIKTHPHSPGKVIAQGSKIWLSCVAAPQSVKYQWYKNGQKLDGKETSILLLNELYPDPNTGDTRFEYLCEVYNDYEHVFSRAAIFKLADANKDTTYVAEEKFAFLIANDKYKFEASDKKLKTPPVDVIDLAKLLKSSDFKVIALRNLGLKEMKSAFKAFCKLLKVNSYVVFFFAGHGFECFGQTYLLPVDCSENFLPKESICVEYILQEMQKTKPALNLLLIDSCRKMPPEPWVIPEKIFEAHMESNTVFGYATSFLNGAYESGERNSFFVKHLKKYITHNKSIPDIIFCVQKDFDTEKMTRKIQNPVLESSLSVNRKLCDELQNPFDTVTHQLPIWAYQERNPIQTQSECVDKLNCSFIVEVQDHMDVYFNGVDIYLYIELKENANLRALHAAELNIKLNMPTLLIEPVEGICLRSINLNLGSKNLVLMKEVLGIQKAQNTDLDGKILLKFDFFTEIIEFKFCVNVEKLKSMNIFF
ncbi:mucosa-associated lymphoid tissue lymphoma translocation protein 1 [Nephila pilipes]|uniref:Mucosa-associated lymphoid tissue lymphoma translocation protein 1 n=1 Tax=Nephila pilipes TaxID=299642 RepID=A0A8X6NFR7_NEPPI|nr:mucosa-associated lymphoid tissue lymphoma translocation protein 1 [Nephila pilipes]